METPLISGRVATVTLLAAALTVGGLVAIYQPEAQKPPVASAAASVSRGRPAGTDVGPKRSHFAPTSEPDPLFLDVLVAPSPADGGVGPQSIDDLLSTLLHVAPSQQRAYSNYLESFSAKCGYSLGLSDLLVRSHSQSRDAALSAFVVGELTDDGSLIDKGYALIRCDGSYQLETVTVGPAP
ncbi:hypothetical protein E4T66_17135 [Sinimarinibacterium sp. CAU 1509]|uniref:hypothetical protein n=1 Tax=Sinimarinibacterium sp. CAU 1509 TaxID=2562283 RepID=UPI0010AC13CE|nr:hypothetical protein [Sinimarinibacterium sp. CAU 1509]TJY57135.1 hypothetical protein E4T66_17135 [Sinimarinibacterium sp. CAU 1509]